MNFSSIPVRDVTRLCHELSALLDTEQQNFEVLHSVLNSKERALIEQNFEALSEASQREQVTFQTADSIAAKRQELVERVYTLLAPASEARSAAVSGFPNLISTQKGRVGMDAMISRLPAILGVMFQKKAERIREQAANIKKQLEKNRSLVRIGLEQVQFVMEAVRDKMVMNSSPGNYSAPKNYSYARQNNQQVRSISLNISA